MYAHVGFFRQLRSREARVEAAPYDVAPDGAVGSDCQRRDISFEALHDLGLDGLLVSFFRRCVASDWLLDPVNPLGLIGLLVPVPLVAGALRVSSNRISVLAVIQIRTSPFFSCARKSS